MSRIKENIVERYIHFVILAVFVLISLALIAMFGVKSPNSAEIKGGKFGPGQIDKQIQSQAKMLDTKLKQDPKPKGRYSSKYKEFEKLYAMSLEGYQGLVLPMPSAYNSTMLAQRFYDVPIIPNLTEIEVACAREVAHVPQIQVNSERSYQEVDTAPGDIDLVTVEARLDFSELAENFRKSFASLDIKREWKDDELAKVIFANVNLQRQVKLEDGSWGEWEDVSRTAIDRYAEFMEFAENVNDLEKGVNVLKIQFQTNELWQNLLQPESYEIAQADLLWYPPSLYGKYLREKKIEERELQKAEQEKRKSDRGGRTRTKREKRTPTVAPGGGGMPGMGGPGMGMPGMGAPTENKRTRKPREKEDKKQKQEVDVEQEYQDILITQDDELQELSGEIAIWAHDDSTTPDNTYRYRLRVGVFNPVAGLGWYKEEYQEYNDRVVLWSEYTAPTEEVFVEGRNYILPISETSKGVKVAVAKYKLGLWLGHEFSVSPGDKIGDLVEVVKYVDEQGKRITSRKKDDTAKKVIEEIDLSTSATFIRVQDAKTTVTMGSASKEVDIREFVYSLDGEELLVPIGQRYWASALKTVSKNIKSDKDKEIEILERGATGNMRKSPGMGMPGMGMPGMGMPGMGMPGL